MRGQDGIKQHSFKDDLEAKLPSSKTHKEIRLKKPRRNSRLIDPKMIDIKPLDENTLENIKIKVQYDERPIQETEENPVRG